MNKELEVFIKSAESNFASIPDERKELLLTITNYIKRKLNEGLIPQLVYICTHNSRRSQFGQVWAKVAAEYYKIAKVKAFSGGTEVTEFNKNAINALQSIGFMVMQGYDTINKHYSMFFDSDKPPIECFSKLYDDKIYNPQSDFCAVMTCDSADENCPFISGAEMRVVTTYEDPKISDGTLQQERIYLERCKQIATETIFVFNHVLK